MRRATILAGTGVLALLGGFAAVAGPSASASPAPAAVAAGGAAPADWNQGAYQSTVRTVTAHAPSFPPRTCDITGSRYAPLVRQVVDGQGSSTPATVWYYGDAINAAIRACHTAGGGTVVIPAQGSRDGGGVFYSGAITLLSNVDLQVATGATVKFVRDPANAFYPVVLTSNQGVDLYNYSPLVYALNQKNIALTGGGTLDAQDNVSPWQLPVPGPGGQEGTATVLASMNAQNLPVNQRIFSDDGHMPARIPELSGCPPQSRDWGPCASLRYAAAPAGTTAYASTFVPQFAEFNHSEDVLVQGVHLVNTQFWQIHPLNSRNVFVRDVTVDDTAHHTDDGIDPESCDDVVIENNSITTLDDGIAIKSGKNQDGRDLRAPSENIVIQGNDFSNPSGGSASISIGSEMSGGVADVFAQDNTSGGAGTAFVLKIKTNAYRGGYVRDIYVRDGQVTQTIRGIVNFDTNYAESGAPPGSDLYNPDISGVYIDHVDAAPSVTTSYPPFVIYSDVSRSPIQDVYYANSVFYTTSTFQSAFSATVAKFFKNLTIRDVTFINPKTGARTVYNTAPLRLSNQTEAQFPSRAVRLAPASLARPSPVTRLPSGMFTLSPDGRFTTGPITLDDSQYWYAGRHYLAVNFYNGININTVVYQVCSGTGCRG